ncbi:MAG TPA: hypothetical protein ENO23_09020 [Alphaproteobacteria bacterium]|nr:hypothetical protein [Alphaproteobacteria bacterium]
MALMTARILLLAALLLLPAVEGLAYRIDLVANWDPTAACSGQTCIGTVTPTVEVWLDTEGEADIALLGFGVSFAEPGLSYDRAASSTSTYVLYTAANAPYLVPSSSCGGRPGAPTAGQGCDLFPGTTNIVHVGFASSNVPNGVPGSGRALLATLVFQAAWPSPHTVDAVFDPEFGGAFLLGDSTSPPLGFTVTYAPDPSTGALLAAGLGLLAAARRRAHRGGA